MFYVLNAWSLPQRDELLVALLSDHSVEIVQTNAAGEESGPVRIDSWDLPELIELLDQARRYQPPAPPKPPLESMSAAPKQNEGGDVSHSKGGGSYE